MIKSALLCWLIGAVVAQLAYPEASIKGSAAGRIPLYAPEKCKDPNELLYPGNQENDWICDCLPGFIFYPGVNRCFPAYRKGPCKSGQHLVLRKGQVIPECVDNPCRDGYARFDGCCYELGKPNGPCEPELLGGGIFDINSTTLEPECIKGLDRISQLLDKLPKDYKNYRNTKRL